MKKGLDAVTAVDMIHEARGELFAQSTRLRGLSYSPVYGFGLKNGWLTRDRRGRIQTRNPTLVLGELIDKDWWVGTLTDFYIESEDVANKVDG